MQSEIQVDPKVGGWDAVNAIQDGKDLCVDFMVNHTSAQSKEFKDFIEKGDKVRSHPQPRPVLQPLQRVDG